MVPRDRDIIDQTHITVLSTADFNLVSAAVRDQFLRIDDVEYLLLVVLEALEDDEILLGLLDANNVHNLAFVGDFKWKDLLADLAVDFVKFQHDLATMHSSCSLGLEPRSQALQMDHTLSACAFTR